MRKEDKSMSDRVLNHMLEAAYEDGYNKGKGRAYIESILLISALVIFMYASRV